MDSYRGLGGAGVLEVSGKWTGRREGHSQLSDTMSKRDSQGYTGYAAKDGANNMGG